VLLAGCAQSEGPTTERRYLDAALMAGRWLQAESPDGSGGGIPDELSDSTVTSSLGTGAAGRALFFSELFVASADSSFLRSARAAATVALEGAEQAPDAYGLYDGLSGIAFALAEVGALSGDSLLRADAERLFRQVLEAGSARGTAAWGDVNDVLVGTAGVGLALLYAFDAFGDPAYLSGAIRAADALLDVAEPVPGGGLRWMRGQAMQFDLPNFSHGTSGVAYFLARVGDASGFDRFSEAAQQGAAYLESIAEGGDSLFLVPYGIPNDGWATPFDIGWAHGPAGTARLHYELWRRTGDVGMWNRVITQAATILASGVPGPSRDTARWVGPFRIDRRFGTSGAADFLIAWSEVSQNVAYLERARRITDTILDSAIESTEGMFWSLPLYGFQGGEGTGVFTGFFYGAAGLGLTLLHQHYAETAQLPLIRLPDDPFPRRERRDV
jgi:lantibiotic modifying enzyme